MAVKTVEKEKDAFVPPERIRGVTVPTIKHEVGTTLYLFVKSKIKKSDYVDEQRAKKEGENQKPADIMAVFDLRDREEYRYVLGTVVLSSLTREYPDHSYVGRSFSIEKKAKETNKRYNQYQIFEVKTPEWLKDLKTSEDLAVSERDSDKQPLSESQGK